jgi:hypothetical protein
MNFTDEIWSAFDIDVDIAPLLGGAIAHGDTSAHIDSRWYELAAPKAERPANLQEKLDGCLHNHLLRAQWRLRSIVPAERRAAPRSRLVARIHPVEGEPLVCTNISKSGLRCVGTPQASLMDIEFSVPGTPFPVDAKVRVVNFTPSNVTPMVSMRFVDIDEPYADEIDRYVHNKQVDRLAKAA